MMIQRVCAVLTAHTLPCPNAQEALALEDEAGGGGQEGSDELSEDADDLDDYINSLNEEDKVE